MKRGCAIALLLTACLGCTSPPTKTRYFALAEARPARTAADDRVGQRVAYRVAFGPASLPEAVDRRQMVLRVAPGQYAISDENGWVAPLPDEIPRSVAEAVQARLPEARTVVHPLHAGQDADYRVTLTVTRFESAPGDAVTLAAAWRIGDRTDKLLRESSGSYAVPVAGPDVAALVAAHRLALARLGADIARDLDGLAASRR